MQLKQINDWQIINVPALSCIPLSVGNFSLKDAAAWHHQWGSKNLWWLAVDIMFGANMCQHVPTCANLQDE